MTCAMKILSVLLTLAVCLSSCSPGDGRQYVFDEGTVFATVYHLTYASPRRR